MLYSSVIPEHLARSKIGSFDILAGWRGVGVTALGGRLTFFRFLQIVFFVSLGVASGHVRVLDKVNALLNGPL